MEKLSPNPVQLFLRNKYKVFTMGGTVALRSVNKNLFGDLQFCSYLRTRQCRVPIMQMKFKAREPFCYLHNQYRALLRTGDLT